MREMRGALQGAATRVCTSMNAQNVSNTMWALATLGWQAEDGAIRGALQGAAMRVCALMTAQNVSNTLWALATLGWQAEYGAMRGALEEALMRVCASMNVLAVTNTLWALATLGWQAREESMRAALEGTLTRVAPSMSCRNVANTLWALATLGWHSGDGAMRGALQVAAMRVCANMHVQQVANSLWALATLGWSAIEMADRFDALVKALFAGGRPSDMPRVALSQLLQAHLASQFLGLGLVSLPASTLPIALEAYREEARKLTVSSVQAEITESLRRLGIAHELEHITADGPFSIDLAVVDRRIAIELDGPSQFTASKLEPIRHTRLRHRLLSAMGWHVVSIPVLEWSELRRGDQKDALIEQRLRQTAD
jgi:hypothetical protein